MTENCFQGQPQAVIIADTPPRFPNGNDSNDRCSREVTEQKQSIADCWQWLILSENLFSRIMSDSDKSCEATLLHEDKSPEAPQVVESL